MAFGERLTKGANLAHSLSGHLHVERISDHILRWRRRVGAARPPGKCTFERISPDAKVNRIRAKCELFAGRLCATARQHTLELLVLGKEINPAADESEGPASSAIDHGVADQLHDLGAGIDAQAMVHGRDDVCGTDQIFGGVAGVAVGFAVDLAAADAAAGHDDVGAARPVASAAFALDQWGPAKLAHPDDQGFVEQPTHRQVVQ